MGISKIKYYDSDRREASDELREFFNDPIAGADAQIASLINSEFNRQNNQIELIASENIVSKAVLEAQGSVLTNKYAEGYPGRRYYGGCEFVDVAETLAQERVKQLFNCSFANVQPHSGAQANQTVFLACLKPGDTILGMSLDAGGHLTHGAPPNQSGKWFNSVQYGVRKDTALIDYEQVEQLASSHRPKLIIAGGSAYSRVIDFEKFKEIADSVGAFLLVDMAHFSGLVAGGVHPNPLPHADIVTSTTHKTLRGPRGGMILTNNEELFKKINSALFPGLQGGPLMHVIAAKAVAFGEALKPSYKTYVRRVIENAQVLASGLSSRGINIVSGGTDTHLLLVDLQNKNVTGRAAEIALESVGITCNKNGVPFDPLKPAVTSGVRLGSPACTTRGFGIKEFQLIADLIADTIEGLGDRTELDEKLMVRQRKSVTDLCFRFPIY
ncbi:serine hydroxymethyltransferase [Rhodospirillaceae bacterium]|nr:serine hydroxymethyltransferase [Rhodospirillaceae bacterium]